MIITESMIEEIRKIIDEKDFDLEYDKLGVRVQEEAFSLGEIDHRSHIWDDGNDTGEEMDGLCITDINKVARNQKDVSYFGDHVALIGCNRFMYDERDGEIIAQDPRVLAIIS